MSESLEALDELSLMINREKHINSEWNKKINDLKQPIKQDLERLQQLEKENQELIVNKNVAQAIALNQKREIDELKDQISYLKEDGEEWQSAYEWSQAQNSILKLKNQELKEIIKANFFYHKNSEEIGYRKPMPKYQDKIKEVLENEN